MEWEAMNAVYDIDIKLSLVHPDLWMKERTMLMKIGGAINGAPERKQRTTITIVIPQLSKHRIVDSP